MTREAIHEALSQLGRRQDLTADQAARAMEVIWRGDATPSQIAGFAVGLRVKGETVDEIVGIARATRAFATPIQLPDPGSLVDVVGTGPDPYAARSGDEYIDTFNISTLAAIVAAACGAKVAKHGSRVASTLCGSADLLEALGVNVDLPPEGIAACIRSAGFGFLLFTRYHPAFRFAWVPRSELGMRTVFSSLPPICNPVAVGRQVLGVADPALAAKLCQVLAGLGVKRVIVVHGGGTDELVTGSPSLVLELLDGERQEYWLEPTTLGLRPASPADLRGGTPAQNAEIARAILGGDGGRRTDVVLLNASAVLRAANLAGDWEEGITLAREAIATGRAAAVLEKLKATSNDWATAGHIEPSVGRSAPGPVHVSQADVASPGVDVADHGRRTADSAYQGLGCG